MDWVFGIIIVLAIFVWIGNATEKNKKEKEQEAEILLRKERAETARTSILASGDKELIQKLHLMEASYQSAGQTASNQAAAAGRSGPGLIGTAAAVAGGMVVGNVISGAVQAAQLEAALQDIQADLGADTQLSMASLDGADVASSDEDFDLEL